MEYQSPFLATEPVLISPTHDARSERILACLTSLKYRSTIGNIPSYMNGVLENEGIATASHISAQLAIAQLRIAQEHQAHNLRHYPSMFDAMVQSQHHIASKTSSINPGLDVFEVAALIQQQPLIDLNSAASYRLAQRVALPESNLDNASIVSHENLDNSSNDVSEKSTSPIYVDKIGANDILCGRGGRSNHHIGNKRYRLVVARMKYMYQQCAAKTMKTDLSRAIVKHCSSYGAQFVKLDESNGKFYVLSNAEARKKTSQALRESKALKWIS
jgi:hypothetical protein